MADEQTLQRLRALARKRDVSFAEIVREALDDKASAYRPKPKSLGIAGSGRPDVSGKAGVGRTPPRSWR